MDRYLNLLSLLILLSSFVLMSDKRIKSYIDTFRLQSFLIAVATGIIGVSGLVERGYFDALILSAVIFAAKVIVIPRLLHKTYANVEYRVEKDFFMNIPILILVCCALVVFTWFTVSSVTGINDGPANIQAVNSISLVLIGMFFMISRRKAIGQIVGFLVIENGLFVTALFLTKGMPFIVDIGILIDLITAVLIMGVMVFRINEKFESIDTNKLKKLRG